MNNLKKPHPQTGFTLIEIAIVLVIIGLLLGGVLKGQEMIVQGRIKNVIADFNGVQAAFYGYQDRYRAIPGDDGGAAARWPAVVGGAAQAVSGGGTGAIAGNYNVAAAALDVAKESNLFWHHLRRAGFIPGVIEGNDSGAPPLNAAGGMVGVQNGALGLAGVVLCSANLPAKIAMAVDTQLDDGVGTTGQIRGQDQGGATNPAVGAATADADAYVDDGSALYVICKSL